MILFTQNISGEAYEKNGNHGTISNIVLSGVAEIVFGYVDSGIFLICFNYNVYNESQIYLGMKGLLIENICLGN